MQSLSNLPTADQTEGVHGLPWPRVFAIRNTIAKKFCNKFNGDIPLEEFLSEANLVIAQAVQRFRADDSPSTFASYLWRLLDRRMLSVVRREWAGSVVYTYGAHTTKRHRRVVATTYQPPRLCAIPPDPALVGPHERLPHVDPALLRPPPQEAACFAHECLAFLAQAVGPREYSYFLRTLAGESGEEIRQEHGENKRTVERCISRMRDELRVWAGGVRGSNA